MRRPKIVDVFEKSAPAAARKMAMYAEEEFAQHEDLRKFAVKMMAVGVSIALLYASDADEDDELVKRCFAIEDRIIKASEVRKEAAE